MSPSAKNGNQLEDRWAGLQNSALFTGMSPVDFGSMLSIAMKRDLEARETIFIEGDPVREVFLLVTGSVKISQLGQDGSEAILMLAGPGDVVGALGLIANCAHFSTAQSLHSCQAMVWDAATFDRMAERFPILQKNLRRILAARLEELQARFREISTERVAARLARELGRLLERVGRPVDGAIEISLSREELAQMIGTTLFTVSRLLSDWSQRGIVDPKRGVVVVRDLEGLANLADAPS